MAGFCVDEYLFNLFLLCLVFVQPSTSSSVESTYLKFSTQKEAVLIEAKNFATLKSPDSGVLSSGTFSICGSIYIGFYRDCQAFYTLRKNDSETVWLSLSIYNQDTLEETYTLFLFYSGGAIFPNSSVNLRPHAWSHACTTVDVESGQVLVVMNGIITHNTTINSKDFKNNMPTVFRNNLVLGITQMKPSGAPEFIKQSEASTSDVNVFSVPLTIPQMVNITSTGQPTEGDIVSWSEATWRFNGDVFKVKREDVSKTSSFPNLYKMADGFHSWSDCMELCPRIQAGGRVPLTLSLEEAGHLAQLYSYNQSKEMFWAPFMYNTEGVFIDYYTGTPMTESLWVPGQPNGGLKQQCTHWSGDSAEGRLYDSPRISSSSKGQCLCQLSETPLLRLRGLCKGSKIDTHYTMKSINGSVVFLGLTGTEIRFVTTSTIPSWKLSVNQMNTTSSTPAEESSFILGRYTWSVSFDSAQCFGGGSYSTDLKMSGCRGGEFTCSNGDCVSMEDRCDQVSDCPDKTDEVNCTMIVLEESYRKASPPVTLNVTNKRLKEIIPAPVRVAFTLMDISAIREAENEIDIKFSVELEWNETRATYHNLKKKMSQNIVDTSKSSLMLWTPKLIFENNKDNDDTRSEFKTSRMMINRKGNFTRSSIEVVNEIELFKGKENPIIMIQSYTKEFRCKYNLEVFPFDTQVRLTVDFRNDLVFRFVV